MGKHSRSEEGNNDMNSHDDYKNRGKSRTMQQQQQSPTTAQRDEQSLDDQPQQQQRSRGNGERNVRKSKIRDLLHSVKDDVIQMKENETLPDDNILTDPNLHPGGHGNFHQRTFTRVSPQKSNGGDDNDSKWKKAVKLSRVMIRPFQSLSIARDFNKGNESDEETGEEPSSKMMGLLRILDHCSCISSGILAGFLTINAVLWIHHKIGFSNVSYTENFIRFYYSTAVVLTYITLTGYLVRLYVTWSKISAMLLTVHIAAFLAVLIFHYICKGYDLLKLECSLHNKNNSEPEKVVAYHCPRNGTSSMGQPEVMFIIISQTVQTLGAIFIVFFFHFTPYVQPWVPTWIALGPKIKSMQIMSP